MISVKQSGLQRRQVAKIGPAALGSNPSLFKRKRRADTLVRTFLPLTLLPFLPYATTFFSCAYFHVQCIGISPDEAQHAEQRTRCRKGYNVVSL